MTETYAYSCESDLGYQQLTAGWKSVEASYSIYIYFITISSVLGIVTQTNLVSAISRVTFYLSFYRTVVIITYVITIVMNTRWWGSPGDPNDEGQNVIEHSFDTATTRSKELIAHVVLGNHKWEKKKKFKNISLINIFFLFRRIGSVFLFAHYSSTATTPTPAVHSFFTLPSDKTLVLHTLLKA